MGHSPLTLLLTVAAFLAVAVPANAAGTVLLQGGYNQESIEREREVAVYAGGEDNSLAVSRDGQRLIVTDTAPLSGKAGCTNETPTRVVCPLPTGEETEGEDEPVQAVFVDLGGGDDRVDFDASVTGLYAIVEGYAGRDTIGGTEQADFLYGGSGRDRITAKGGNDEVGGDDWLEEESEEPNHRNLRDTIDGGSGSDTAYYNSDGHDGTTIHLGGGKGEDSLSRVENAVGTGSGDTIIGTRAANSIDGYGGSDRIRAGGGADTVGAKGGARDIRCGSGSDSAETTPSDRIASDCERAMVADTQLTTAFTVEDGKLTFAAQCRSYGSDPCAGRLQLHTKGGKGVAASRFSIPDDQASTIQLTLSDEARGLLEEGHVFSVRDRDSYNGFRIYMKGSL